MAVSIRLLTSEIPKNSIISNKSTTKNKKIKLFVFVKINTIFVGGSV